MMEKTVVKKKHRKYDAGFKAEALKMVGSGRSVPDVARSLGIGENLLYKWRAEQKSNFSPAESVENTELESLRKQLRQVEMERDILKKALVIFGRAT